jgi:predicted ATP-dependent serine protease
MYMTVQTYRTEAVPPFIGTMENHNEPEYKPLRVPVDALLRAAQQPLTQEKPVTQKPSASVTKDVASTALFNLKNLPRISELSIEMEWLVDDLIPLEAVVMLSGESGCGKSTLALALASAVAHGERFLGRACKQRHVLIVDKENGPRVYRERFKRLHIDENEYMHIWGLWQKPEPKGPSAEEITKLVGEERPLIIFDSLVAFHDGSELDADDTRDYMDRFRRLASLGATVIVIHHTGKGENTKEYRGSSDIKASVDVAYLLKSEDPAVLRSLELSCFKSREGILEPVKIEVNEAGQLLSVADTQFEIVERAVREHPRSSTMQIGLFAEEVPGKKVQQILKLGLAKKRFRRTKGANNAWCWEVIEG